MFFFTFIEPLGLRVGCSQSGASWLGERLEKAESLLESVWAGGVKPICSAGQVSAKAIAWWFRGWWEKASVGFKAVAFSLLAVPFHNGALLSGVQGSVPDAVIPPGW